MFSSNPYRFLGVLSNSGIKNIQKNLSKIKAYSKIGKHISLPYELNFFNLKELNRSESLILEIENKVLLDPNKIKYSLFWFLNNNSIDEIALTNLDKGNFEKSETIWRKVIKDQPISRKNISAYNNLSTLLFIKSLSDKKNDKFKNSVHLISSIKEAIKLKSELIFSDHLFVFSKLICDNEMSIKKEDLLSFFNESISSLFEENFSKSEVSKIINDSDNRLSDSFNFSLISEPLNSLTELIVEANKQLDEDNSKGLEIGKKLIKDAISHLKLLKGILGEEDIKYQSISDKLANQILQCGILYFNKTGEDKDYVSSYKYAKSISVKDSTLERAKLTIKHCEDELKANVCSFCNLNEVTKTNSFKVKMHKMNWDNTYSYFKNGGIEILACSKCRSECSSKKNLSLLYTLLTYGAVNFLWGIPFILDVLGAYSGNPFWIFKLINKAYKNSYFDLVSKHPMILKLKLEGYKFGMP